MTPTAYKGNAPRTRTEKEAVQPAKPKRPYRKLKAEIKLLLAAAVSPVEIADRLRCERGAVYRYLKTAPKDSVQAKIDRFNQRRPGYLLDKKLLDTLTEWKCAVTGAPIDAERDSFCIGVIDNLPAVYLSRHKTLAQSIERLRGMGWRIEKPE